MQGREVSEGYLEGSQKIQEPYIASSIPYIGLDEDKVKSRVTQVRRELHQGTMMVRKCKKVHCPIDTGETGLMQSSGYFYDQGAAKMQQMMVLSCFALLKLFSLADVSSSEWDHGQSTV